MTLFKIVILILLLGIGIAIVGCCSLFCAFCISCLTSEAHRYKMDTHEECELVDESMVD